VCSSDLSGVGPDYNPETFTAVYPK